MIRMEIALILIMLFVAWMYIGAEKKETTLHRTFALLLGVVPVHLVFDAVTIYTVNHLDSVPLWLNDLCHRIFMGTMAFIIMLFYQYIAALVEEETGKPRTLDLAARLFFAVALVCDIVLPVQYITTSAGNYSDGSYAYVSYGCVAFYLMLCAGLLLRNWKELDHKKKYTIGVVLLIELTVCVLQRMNPTWLISGMGITLMTLAFYFTLENPDIIRAELTEQKMSMPYLKSQVNPHFLYNTLDAIRIQAELDGDKKVAELLMKLVGFFRQSVKVDQPIVALDDELTMIEAYLELMCYRYPSLQCSYDIDPELGGAQVPNFILQPLVENSLLHGLKDKGYQGGVQVTAQQTAYGMELCIRDSGNGFPAGKKAQIDGLLEHAERMDTPFEGSSIGILNVQKRIRLMYGRQYGLSYEENPDGGVTVHVQLPLIME